MWKNISLPCEKHQKSACSLFKWLPEPAAVASWGVIAAHRVFQPQRSPSCQFPIWPPWILVHFRKQMTYTMTNTNTEYTKADHFLEAAKKAWESRRTGRGPFLITHPTSVQTLLLPQHSWLLNSKKDSKQVKKMKSPASRHFYKKKASDLAS